MGADQGNRPAVPPPDEHNNGQPVDLPPWLQEAGEAAQPEPQAPPPPPPSKLPPPPPPRPAAPPPEDAPTRMMPAAALPPWLQGADEPKEPAAPAPDDWLTSAGSLPEAAESALTYDEWAAIQKKLAQPPDLEQEVPDLTAGIEEPAPAAPGTGTLQDPESLPGWFLGLEEINEDELPDWYTQSGELTGEPPAAAAPDATDWAGDPFEASALDDDGEELPDLSAWAGGEDGGATSPLPEADGEEDPSFDAQPEPETNEAADEPDFAFVAPVSEAESGDPDFDEPTFEWVSNSPAEPDAPDLRDAPDEPDLDEFMKPPPEAAPAPLMDDQATAEWLTELEGMVADVNSAEPDVPEFAPSLEQPGTPIEEAAPETDANTNWMADFGFEASAPTPVGPSIVDAFDAETAALAAAPPPEPVSEPAPSSEPNFDDLLGPALAAGSAAAVVRTPDPDAIVEPAFGFTRSAPPEAEPIGEPDFETLIGAAAVPEPATEPSDEPDFEALLGGMATAASAPEPDPEPADGMDFDTLFADLGAELDASIPGAEPESGFTGESEPEPSAEEPDFAGLFAESPAPAVAATEPEAEPESGSDTSFDSLLADLTASGFEQSVSEPEPAAGDPDLEALFGGSSADFGASTPASELDFDELHPDLAASDHEPASGDPEWTDEPDLEALFGGAAVAGAAAFAASSQEPEPGPEPAADEPDFETLFAAASANELYAAGPEPEPGDDLQFDVLFEDPESELTEADAEAEPESDTPLADAAAGPEDGFESAEETDFDTLLAELVAAEAEDSTPEPEPEPAADEPDFETLFGAADNAFVPTVLDSEPAPVANLDFDALFGESAASEFAASMPEAAAEPPGEPDFETLFADSAAAEFAASGPESEPEPGFEASESEMEPGAEPASERDSDAWLGAAALVAGAGVVVASTPEDAPAMADEDEQPALADLGWLMDMQGSGELTVTGPEAPAEQSPEELAAFTAMFAAGDVPPDDDEWSAPLDQESTPLAEMPAEGDDSPNEDGLKIDTGWLRDDIFGEPETDEVAPAEPMPDTLAAFDAGPNPELDALGTEPAAGYEHEQADVLALFDDELASVPPLAAAPAAAAAAADELPDWMLDDFTPASSSAATGDALPNEQDWLIGLGLAAGRVATGGLGGDASSDTDMAAAFLAPAEDEWLQKLQTGRLGDEEPAEEAPPVTRTGLTAELVSQVEDIDEYLAMLSAPGVAPELAIVASPDAYDIDKLLDQNLTGTGDLAGDFDWFDTPKSAPAEPEMPAVYDPYRGAQPFFAGDLTELGVEPQSPEWLTDVTVSAVSAGAIARQQKDRPESELDERLQKLRRRSQAEPAADQADLTALTPAFGAAARPGPGTLALTPEQDRQAGLLLSLVGTTTGAAGAGAVSSDAAPASPKDKPASRERDGLKWTARSERWVIFAVLAAAVLLPFLFPALRIGQPPPAAFEPGSPAAAASGLVDSLPPGALVLIGLDYGLGASPELDVLTDALLRHLFLKNTYPVLVSSNPAMLARAQALVDVLNADDDFMARLSREEPLTSGRDFALANFLPGGALGLRAFSEDTANLLVPALKGALPGVFISGLNDFRLIAVLTDRAEDVRLWAEQIAPLADAPVVAGVAYSAAPLAEPYLAAGLLDGLWTGYQDGVTYSLMTGGVLTGAPGQTSAPPVIEAAPHNDNAVVPLTVLTATFTPTSTPTPSPTPSPTRTPTITPTPVPRRAVVAGTQGVNLRENPATGAPILRVLQPGTPLVVLRLNDDESWAEVQLNDGGRGWISTLLINIEDEGAAAPGVRALGKRPAPVQQGRTASPTPTPTPSPTRTPRATQDAEALPARTSTRTPRPAQSPDASPARTATRTPRPTRTAFPTDTPSPTRTPTRTPSRTPTTTHTPASTHTPTMTHTPSATYTPAMTPTPTPFLVTGSGVLDLPAHTPGYRDERWYALTMGILVSAGLITAGAVVNLLRALRRRR